MSTKTFPIADVIAAHSGILLTEGGFDRLWAVADHVTGQSLMTHQVGSEHPSYAAALAKQHPFLETLDVPSAKKGNFNTFTVNAWLADVCDKHGEMLEISTEPGYRKLNHVDGLPDHLLRKVYVMGVPEADG